MEHGRAGGGRPTWAHPPASSHSRTINSIVFAAVESFLREALSPVDVLSISRVVSRQLDITPPGPRCRGEDDSRADRRLVAKMTRLVPSRGRRCKRRATASGGQALR